MITTLEERLELARQLGVEQAIVLEFNPALAALSAEDFMGRVQASMDLRLLVVGSGGAPLSPAVKDQLTALLPNTFVIDSFGSSETGYQGRATEGRRFAVGDAACPAGDP